VWKARCGTDRRLIVAGNRGEIG
jgi:hypothetical protein